MKRYIKSNRYSNLTPIFAKHMRYDKQASKILSDSGMFTPENATKIINSLLHEDIHAFVHSDPWLEKYLKGIARMIVEESHGSTFDAADFVSHSIPVFDAYLTYVKELRDKLGGVSYDNKFINEMHFSDVEQAIKDFKEEYYSDISDISRNPEITGYSLIPINSYDEFHEMFGGHWTGNGVTDEYAGHGGTAWCHANSESTYDSWTNGHKKFFVLAADNWKDIQFDPISNAQNPKDAYGNSLIALRTDYSGYLLNATLRCNHVGVIDNPDNQYKTYEQLSALTGFDVESAITKYIEDYRSNEIYDKNSKYEMLTTDTIHVGNRTLFRIRAITNFDLVEEGELGGYIESLNNLSESGDCWVYSNAMVFGDAYVVENAQVHGNARVFGGARVAGDAVVYGNASIYGIAKVYEHAIVNDDAQIFGGARVVGYSTIYGKSKVSGDTVVYDRARIFGNAQVTGNSRIYELARVFGNSFVYGSPQIHGHAFVFDNAVVCGEAEIYGSAKIHGDAQVGGNTIIMGPSIINSGVYNSGTYDLRNQFMEEM